MTLRIFQITLSDATRPYMKMTCSVVVQSATCLSFYMPKEFYAASIPYLTSAVTLASHTPLKCKGCCERTQLECLSEACQFEL
mmetsp:Transcript_52955/g.110450  ORF Transcript_52955/g.110450 Transcript_52955/m.110450 type:complete len:83 (-) Transcript_52955:139-387(-)